MKIVEFMKQYPDEQSCKAAWKRLRDKVGVVCPVCGGIVHYWKRDKEMGVYQFWTFTEFSIVT